MSKLKTIFMVLSMQVLLISCASAPQSGSGFLIGRVDLKNFGDPIFQSVSPLETSVTYLDRDSGIAFVSAERYEATDAIHPIRSGSTMLPHGATQGDEYLDDAYRMVICKQRGDCSEISLCDNTLLVHTANISSIYSELQSRGFPVAQLSYISEGNNTYNVTVSYFADCERIAGDVRLVMGSTSSTPIPN
ncbi:MAG: hypothetical protein ACR2O7_02725 [Parasphingorhabdus sp.]